MKKSLALVLALMMILSMFTMGISVSAADMPAGATAINSVEGLASMEAGKYYYLTADITLGSPATLDEQVDIGTQADAIEPAEEADLITIPAGVTLDGNGYTIYYGNYITNPGWYASNNKFTHSLDWTHEMFAFAAGDTITLKNLKIGSAAQPVYLSTGAAPATKASDNSSVIYDGSNDGFGMFRDDIGVNVEWDNVNFYVERYGRGLGSYNFGAVLFSAYGNHNFNNCGMNVSVMSAGSQYGLWISNKVTANAKAGALTFTNCINKGFSIDAGYDEILDEETGAVIGQSPITWNGECWGSVGNGFIYFSRNNTTMTNCINNLKIGATYGGTGYHFSGFIGSVENGSATLTACVNNGDFSLNKISIGGGIIGRTQSGACTDFVIKNCINNGNIKRSSSEGVTSNHGFGGITGHTGSTTTYEVSGCTNYGNIQGVGNIGGVVGFFEGTASLYTIKNNVNYGDITSVGNVEAGGIVGQARMNADITNCKNFGNINAAENNGGILGAGWTADTVKNITNCVNYGTIGSTSVTHAGGIVGIAKTHKMTYNLTNCVNYGKIITKQYSAGIFAEVSVDTTLNITNCQNYGEIAGVHAVAGFIGQTANGAAVTITIKNSLNAGDVHQSSAAGEGLGGFFGRIAGTKPVIKLEGCVNTGTITGSTKDNSVYGFFGDSCGQFIGLYTVSAGAYNYAGSDVADAGIVGGFHNWNAEGANKPTLTNCRALGETVLSSSKSLKGWITASRGEGGAVTSLTSDKYFYDSNVVLTAPANNGYYGVNVEVAASSTIWDANHPANQPAALFPTLKSMFGQDFIAGNTDLGENAVVTATPMLRGYQMSLDGSSIRFIATINTSNYANVGFVYTITSGGNEIAKDASNTVETIWTSLNVSGKDGSLSTVSAADLGAKYMTGITFNNIPAVGVFEFTVTPVATDANGNTVYTGAAYVITVTHGAVTSVTK